MPKASIVLGFTKDVESAPGVWTEENVELPYKADILSYNKEFAAGEGLNTNVEFRNRYSIVMKDDKQFYEDIKYVKMGQKKWTVSALEFLDPRIILTIGGVYGGG